MTPMKQTLVAGGILWLSCGSASAAPAIASEDLNLRAGAGSQYGVVAVIPGGATVDARGCGGGWCRVSYAGRSGFARRDFLAFGGRASGLARAANRDQEITNPLLLPGIRPWTW